MTDVNYTLLIRHATDNAKKLIQHTQCKEAASNYEAIKCMSNIIETQNESIETLIDTCEKSAQIIKDYKKFVSAVQDYVGEYAFHEILRAALGEHGCLCSVKGGDAR